MTKRTFTDEDVQFIFDYVAKVLPGFPVPKQFPVVSEIKRFKISPLGWIWDWARGNMGEFIPGNPIIIGTIYRDDRIRSIVTDHHAKAIFRLIIHENIHYTLYQQYHKQSWADHPGWGDRHLKKGIEFYIADALASDFLKVWNTREAQL